MIFARTGFALQILWMTWHLCDASRNSNSHHKCAMTKPNVANCSHKHFSTVPDLHPYHNVTILILSNNSISTLHSRSFAMTPNLTNLQIAHNHLKALDDQSFVGLKSLFNLDLSNNRLKSISDKVFGSDLSNLHTLRLDNNSLTKISRHIFDHLKNLKFLHLEHNMLSSIHGHAFSQFKAIEWISIDHNLLNNVTSDWFDPIKQSIKHVAMNHNPWICDARVCDYKKWLDGFSHEKRDVSNMLSFSCCHGQNTSLNHIPTDVFCHSLSQKDKHIKVTPNSDATVQCHSDKSTQWTVMTMRKNGTSACHQIVKTSNDKLKVTSGQILIKGVQKSDTGRYCCTGQNSKYSKCVTVKLATKSSSGAAGSGAIAAICIIVIVVVIGGVYCFCRRKRRNYGVLRDEGMPPSSNSERFGESANFTQHSATTVEKSEVADAYV